MEDKSTVKLRTEKLNIIDANEKYRKENYTDVTLKDISIIMHRACGQGVIHNLAYELSNILQIDSESMLYALDVVRDKYINISNQDALNMFFGSKEHFPAWCFHSDIERKKLVLQRRLERLNEMEIL